MDHHPQPNYQHYWNGMACVNAWPHDVSNCLICIPYALSDPANRIPANPCTVVIKTRGEDIIELFMCEYGAPRNPVETIRLPIPLNFLIHTRKVALDIESEDQFLDPGVIPKIHAIFGQDLDMAKITLYNICLSNEVVDLATHFNASKVKVVRERDGLALGVRDLGSIEDLEIEGISEYNSLLCLEDSRNLKTLKIKINIRNQTPHLIERYLSQWKDGDREISNWRFYHEGDWSLQDRKMKQDDPFADHFLQLEVMDYGEGDNKITISKQDIAMWKDESGDEGGRASPDSTMNDV